MQIRKNYTAVVDAGTNVSRHYSYGMTSTTSVNARTDYFNDVVADFLSECGADAVYEARGEDTDKYLWIRGVPFLFVYSYNSSSKKWGYNLYAPYNTTAVMTGCAYIYNGSTSNVAFSLLFTGNPGTAFALRWIGYGTTAIETGYSMMFYKAKNMLTGRTATAWRLGLSTGTSGLIYSMNAVDLTDDGIFDKNDYSTQTMMVMAILSLQNITHDRFSDKLLLIPFRAGNYLFDGVYQTPAGWLPTPVTASVEQQTEVKIGGRKFLVTSQAALPSFTEGSTSSIAVSANGNYLNMGLVEVTDT